MQFIDLRDQYGITQIVVNSQEMQEKMKDVCAESALGS